MNQLILTPLNLGSVKKGTEQAPYIISSLFKDLVSNKWNNIKYVAEMI